MVIKHQQRAAGLIQVPDSQLETHIPEKDECYLLCCWDFRWDAEECVYLIPKKNLVEKIDGPTDQILFEMCILKKRCITVVYKQYHIRNCAVEY